MTPDDLVERVALRDKAVLRYQLNKHAYRDVVAAAIAVALEEAAKVADGWVGCSEWNADTNSGYECASREIAAAIRAIIKKEDL